MPHSVALISTLAAGLGLALVIGLIATRLLTTGLLTLGATGGIRAFGDAAAAAAGRVLEVVDGQAAHALDVAREERTVDLGVTDQLQVRVWRVDGRVQRLASNLRDHRVRAGDEHAQRSGLGRDDASIVVWEASRGRLYAKRMPFCGYGDKSLDVMLVGDDAAVAEVGRHLPDDGLPVLKEQVRQGGFVCFLMRAQCDLVEAGYEDVLGSMGVVFMGACR